VKKKTKRKIKTKKPMDPSGSRIKQIPDEDNYLIPRFLRVHRARIARHWTWPEHTNQEHEWVLVKQGKIRCAIDSAEFSVDKGGFYFVEPEQWHQENVLSEQLEIITLRFDLLDRKGKPRSFSDPHATTQQYINGMEAQLGELFDRIVALGGQEKPGTEQIIESIILQMIWQVRQHLNQQLPQPSADRISRRREWLVNQAIRYMQQNLHRSLPIAELSQFCCASRHHLAHVFKENMGVSPLQYALQMRMEKAKRLLADQALSVYEVAGQMGFADQFYFSRQFKKVTGLSPKAYRSQL
jgi:AraC-like DNA-binding protein/mannose-6-phosphate isomerase-like protein (cupin superfamily)